MWPQSVSSERAAGAVIIVRVTNEQNFDVAELEAKLGNALANERDRALKIAVNENVAARGVDQIRREPSCSDIIYIAYYSVPRKRLIPIGGCGRVLRERAQDEQKRNNGLLQRTLYQGALEFCTIRGWTTFADHTGVLSESAGVRARLRLYAQ